MLGVMTTQTAMRNGAVTTGCSHFQEFLPFIEEPMWENRPANLCTRRRRVSPNMISFSYPEDVTIDVVANTEPTADEGPGRKPLYLLSTALAKYYQTTENTPELVETKMRTYFDSLNIEHTPGNMTQKQVVAEIATIRCAIEESRLFRDWSETGSAGPYSQFANMDYLFSTLYWVFKIFRVVSYSEYIRVLLCLNRILSKGTGRAKTSQMIKTSNMSKVAEAFPQISNCKDIHLPPYILNFKRLGDLVAVISRGTCI